MAGFFFQAEDGIRDYKVTGVRRVLFRSPSDDRTPCKKMGQSWGYSSTDESPRLTHFLTRCSVIAGSRWSGSPRSSKIGRGACGGRGGISGGGASLKKKKRQ